MFLGDEVYLQAGHPLPVATDYEGFLVAEDGIGLVRRFEDDLARAASRRREDAAGRRVTVVSGALYGPRLAAQLGDRWRPARARGQRPQRVLRRHRGGGGPADRAGHPAPSGGAGDLGEAVLVPAVALRDGEGVFLDDLTPADLVASARRARGTGRAQRPRAGPGAPCGVTR